MKKKIALFLGITLASLSLHAHEVLEHTPKVAPKIEESMYLREGVKEVSLAFAAKEKLQKRGEDSDKEHISVGSRAISQEEYVAQQEKKINKNQEEQTSDELNEEEVLSSRKVFYNSHESAYHFAIGVSYFGDQVTLEDSSVWTIASWDQHKTLNWLTTDTIFVMQNKWVFSSYKFMLVNQNTGKEVEANLFLGPLYSGAFTHWIISVDYFNEEVILNDGSVWHINWWDSSVVSNWLVNDTVIVGVNEFGSMSQPNILINVNVVNYARAICIN